MDAKLYALCVQHKYFICTHNIHISIFHMIPFDAQLFYSIFCCSSLSPSLFHHAVGTGHLFMPFHSIGNLCLFSCFSSFRYLNRLSMLILGSLHQPHRTTFDEVARHKLHFCAMINAPVALFLMVGNLSLNSILEIVLLTRSIQCHILLTRCPCKVTVCSWSHQPWSFKFVDY